MFAELNISFFSPKKWINLIKPRQDKRTGSCPADAKQGLVNEAGC